MRLPNYVYRRAEVQCTQRGRFSSITIVTKLRPARHGITSCQLIAGEEYSLFCTVSRQLWDTHSLIFDNNRILPRW